MGYTVWVITGRGTAEPVAENKAESEAHSIARHPSLSGSRVVVVPSWHPLPVPTSPAVLAVMAEQD